MYWLSLFLIFIFMMEIIIFNLFRRKILNYDNLLLFMIYLYATIYVCVLSYYTLLYCIK